MSKRLEGKVTLITGSSRGIGKALALGFAKQGASIVVTYLHEEAQANAVAEEIDQLGAKALVVRLDVRDSDMVKRAVEATVDRFQTIDVLINNAGINSPGMLHKMKEDDWYNVLDVNLNGPYRCARAVVPLMREKKQGRIINITSVLGEMADLGASNYVTSKAGLIGFTKALAREGAARGITSNAIAAGYVRTEMTDKLDPTIKDDVARRTPMGSFGEVEDIVNAAIYLASDEAGFVTGQVIRVNGGLYM